MDQVTATRGVPATNARSLGPPGPVNSPPTQATLPAFDAPLPMGAASLLARARRMWAEAALQIEPAERFRQAHLAALRAAAAVAAVDSEPSVRSRRRPTSAWVLLAAAAPQLSPWSAYFSDTAVRRAAIETGATHSVPDELADELVSAAGVFINEVAELLHRRPARPGARQLSVAS